VDRVIILRVFVGDGREWVGQTGRTGSVEECVSLQSGCLICEYKKIDVWELGTGARYQVPGTR
jgi:hypothetical protein